MKDVIIVLGGGVNKDGSLPEITKERVEKALGLYKDGATANVLMSGLWGILEMCTHLKTEAEAMDECIVSLGVPADKVFMEEKSRDTIENAFFSKINFLEPKRWKDVIVVTSDFHMERAKYIFDKVLGDEYNIEYVSCITKLSDDRRAKIDAKEKELLDFDKKYLDKIEDGDRKEIENLLLNEHPVYKEKSGQLV